MRTKLTKLLFGDHDHPEAQLLELFGNGTPAPEGLAGALEWGQGVLATAGVPADKANVITATRALRQANRRLDLGPAVHLAKLLAA
jgi:hypothetical protein